MQAYTKYSKYVSWYSEDENFCPGSIALVLFIKMWFRVNISSLSITLLLSDYLLLDDSSWRHFLKKISKIIWYKIVAEMYILFIGDWILIF